VSNCLFPGCNKELIAGKEKLFCKSCIDKIKSGAWTTVKWTGKALVALLAIVPTALCALAILKSQDEQKPK